MQQMSSQFQGHMFQMQNQMFQMQSALDFLVMHGGDEEEDEEEEEEEEESEEEESAESPPESPPVAKRPGQCFFRKSACGHTEDRTMFFQHSSA